MENESAQEAREALASVESAHADAASRLVTPWWYHLVLGVLVAGFVLIYALGNVAVMVGGIVLYFAGLGVLISAYKTKNGVWVSGLRAGKASRWACVLMAVYAVCLVAAVYLSRVAFLPGAAWVLAGVLLAATVIIGRSFDNKLRAQLRSQP